MAGSGSVCGRNRKDPGHSGRRLSMSVSRPCFTLWRHGVVASWLPCAGGLLPVATGGHVWRSHVCGDSDSSGDFAEATPARACSPRPAGLGSPMCAVVPLGTSMISIRASYRLDALGPRIPK